MINFIASVFLLYSTAQDYRFDKPEQSVVLPPVLHEISGITSITDELLACVQDERGVIFFYDLGKQQLVSNLRFHADGDYEGICRVGRDLYVLRSDGHLFRVRDFMLPKGNSGYTTVEYPTGSIGKNNEGLCWDSIGNRLLIACKGKVGKGPEWKDQRHIYAFDLKTHQLDKDPLFAFDLEDIRRFAVEHRVPLPTREKKKDGSSEPFLRFTTSAIAIHPDSHELYVVSSTDHLLFVFGMDGKLHHLEVLDPVRFNKAEGIIFLSDGDLLITNEGQDKRPTLLRFDRKQ